MRDADQLAAADYPPDYPFAPQTVAGGQPAAVPPPLRQAASAAAIDVQEQAALRTALGIGLVIVCSLTNLVMVPLVDGLDMPIIVVGLVYGVLLAQVSMLSLWTVWSERPVWLRVVLGTLLAEILLACFLMGIAMNNPADFHDIARVMMCSLPLVLLCVQAPLWALRIYAGWRIAPAHGISQPQPLSIGQILLATATVAGAVSLVRLASDEPAFYESAWIAWVVAAPSIAGVSLITLPVALYLVLRWERTTSGLFLLWGYATAAIIVVIIVAPLAFGAPIRGEQAVGLFVALYTFAGLLWLLLRVVRAWGYRLVTRG